MRDKPRLKAFYRNPDKVHAGRIDRVVFDADNEEWPVIIFIGKEHFPLHEDSLLERDPEVGDWLVIPRRGEEWLFDEGVLFSDRQFHLLYDQKNRTGCEAAASYADAVH